MKQRARPHSRLFCGVEVSALTSSARESAWLGPTVSRAFPNELHQILIEWVLLVCAIEALITIAATENQLCRFQLGEFILNGPQREEAQARQLTCIQLLIAVREEQSQHFSAHDREQPVE
jgi:hypothetical protein